MPQNAFKGLAVTPAAYAQWQKGQADSPRRVTVLSAEGYIDQLAVDRIQGATAVDASAQNPSKIELYGQHIELADDAQVAAKGGAIKVVATDGKEPMKVTPSDVPVHPEASIHLAKGASIDVSGADVSLGMEHAILWRLKCAATRCATNPCSVTVCCVGKRCGWMRGWVPQWWTQRQPGEAGKKCGGARNRWRFGAVALGGCGGP